MRQFGLVVIGLLLLAGGIAIFADSTSPPGTPMDGNVALSLPISGTPFAPTSFWNTQLPASTPLNPNNTAYVNEIAYNLCGVTPAATAPPPNPCSKPAPYSYLNTTGYSAPLYIVPADQPYVPVKDNCNHTGSLYYLNTVLGPGVPVPADAHPAAGSDSEMQIYQPSTGKYWDFWGMFNDSGTWKTCWGGFISNVAQSNGIFSNGTGAMATSLPLLGAVARIEELQAGHIDHVIGVTIGDVTSSDLAKGIIPANTPGATSGVSWPATRTDGQSTNPLAIPQGLRFRLNPNLDVNSLNLSPVAKAIAVAGQKYGFVVDDSCPGPCFGIRLGDPTTYTAAGLPNPYISGTGVGGVAGTKGLFNGVAPYLVMKDFPWDQLQALPFNYGEPGSTSADTTPPTVSITAPIGGTIQGATIVTAAASDNIGVMSVQLLLDGKPLGAALAKPPYAYSWSTVNVSNGTHTLSAVASDAAGNTKTSAVDTVTVRNPDTTPPSTPVGLTATAPTSAAVKLSWSPSTDNVGVASYRIYRDGLTTPLATVTAPAIIYTDAAVSAKMTYSYTVVAVDAAGNASLPSAAANVSTPANPDTIAPSVPKNLAGQAVGQISITLSWKPSTDSGGSGLAGYHLYRGTTLVASPSTPSYTDSGLAPGTRYTYRVSAYDNAANGSDASLGARIITGGTSPDQAPPTAPGNLHVVPKSKTKTSITLAWNASSDSGGSGLASYEVYRNNALIGSPAANSFTDSGLTAGTTYSYYIVATDNAGNSSAHRRTISVTTKHPWWDILHLGS